MSVTANKEVFYDFLNEYTHFFQEMASFEQQKLDVLLGNYLPDIEHTISVTQANAMQLDNLEQKRIRLQGEAGLAQMSLSELAEDAPESNRTHLRSLVGVLNSCISDIKFYNTKSMTLVQTKLKLQERTSAHELVHPRGDAPTKLSTQA